MTIDNRGGNLKGEFKKTVSGSGREIGNAGGSASAKANPHKPNKGK